MSVPGTTMRNKDEINTFLQDPMDLFELKGSISRGILKVCSRYDKNRDKNDKLFEKLG